MPYGVCFFAFNDAINLLLFTFLALCRYKGVELVRNSLLPHDCIVCNARYLKPRGKIRTLAT